MLLSGRPVLLELPLAGFMAPYLDADGPGTLDL